MEASRTLVRAETRRDFLGEYVAYVYADGHVETDPPHRPVYREDVIRRRAAQIAAKQPDAAVAAQRAAKSASNLESRIERARQMVLLDSLAEFRATLTAVQTLVAATIASREELLELLSNIDIGGELRSAEELRESMRT